MRDGSGVPLLQPVWRLMLRVNTSSTSGAASAEVCSCKPCEKDVLAIAIGAALFLLPLAATCMSWRSSAVSSSVGKVRRGRCRSLTVFFLLPALFWVGYGVFLVAYNRLVFTQGIYYAAVVVWALLVVALIAMEQRVWSRGLAGCCRLRQREGSSSPRPTESTMMTSRDRSPREW